MADHTTDKKLDDERKTSSPIEISSLEAAPTSVLQEGTLDPVYEAKAKVLNKAIQDIGMGRYQWQVSLSQSWSIRRMM